MTAGLRERDRLRDLFGRHVGTEIARLAVVRGISLGGERSDVSVLFVDLVGSTALAESTGPDHVVETLNRFFRCAFPGGEYHHDVRRVEIGHVSLGRSERSGGIGRRAESGGGRFGINGERVPPAHYRQPIRPSCGSQSLGLLRSGEIGREVDLERHRQRAPFVTADIG